VTVTTSALCIEAADGISAFSERGDDRLGMDVMHGSGTVWLRVFDGIDLKNPWIMIWQGQGRSLDWCERVSVSAGCPDDVGSFID